VNAAHQDDDGSPVGSSRALLGRAREFEATEPARARRLVQDARLLARRDGDAAAEGESLYRLAALAHYDGEPGDAFALAVEADEFADARGLPLVRAWCLHLIGLIHTDSGNHAEALAQCLRALSLYRSTDHRVDEGNILNTIATIHHESGDADRAIVNYEAALAANEAHDRADIDALIVANVASLRSERGEHDEAVALAERALDACRVSAPGFLPEVLTAVARVLAARDAAGDLERARDLLADALLAVESSQVVFDDLDRSRIESALGEIELQDGRPDRAIDHWRQALDFARLVDARVQQLEAHTRLARVLTSLRRFEEAVPHLEARFDIQSRLHASTVASRIRTLQIAHEADQFRRRSEILQLRLALIGSDESARTDP
jgi:tetratricopeptide (TPR) repeat protein